MIDMPKDFVWEIIKATFQFIGMFWQLWLIPLALLVFVFLFKYLFERKKTPVGYQYQCRSSIMTPSEREFFKVLLEVVGDRYNVFPQVHLDAILNHRIPGQSWIGAFRHINEKSVDFLLCDKVDEKPLLVIELDDRSHERQDRIARDAEVERIFKAADLPIRRFNLNEAKNKQCVREVILNPAIYELNSNSEQKV